MQLGIKIDSIKGADSIRVWYAPNFLYVFLKSNDTIPIISNSSNIFWYFSSIDTLYTSLIAYGIPQIQNQRYHCNYGKQLYYPMADGCGNFYSLLFEGNFLGDTTHNCEVLPNPLPLKLLSFSAQKESNNVLLNWQTANEVNVSHINVQRSVNSRDFIDIGKVNASCCAYSFVDGQQSTVDRQLYYRLEIVDKDGSKTYSEIKSVDRRPSTVNSISVYPNPAKDLVTIECAGVKELLIIDYLGREVYRSTVDSRPLTVNTKQFNKGIYVIKAIMNNGAIKTEKLVVE
jgi:hypothetical protein